MDTIFYNGCISTLDSKDSFVEAIGIKDGTIQFIGTTQEALKLNCDKKINLHKKLMLPGFVDSHLHMINYAFVENSVKLFDCKSVEDAIILAKKRLIESNSTIMSGLYCRGWNEDSFTVPRYPTKEELDLISTDIPIIMVRVCGHIAVCNTCGLEKLGKIKEFDLIKNDVDFTTGLIRENAVQFFYSALEKPTLSQVEQYIELSMKDLNKKGITGIQSDDFTSLPGKDRNLILSAYNSLNEKKKMTVRVYEQCLFEKFDDLKEFINLGYRTGQGDDFFTLGPVKLLQDGSLGAKTAALSDDYEGCVGNKGMVIFNNEELNQIFKLCHENNMQLAIHCIGDRSMDMVINALEACMSNEEIAEGRHGIVHAQITNKKILKRMSENKIIAYIQPVFIGYDMDIVESRIGKHRMDKVYAWNSMINMGIPVAGGSDAPVESFDIMKNIYFAVTRKKINGFPESGWLSQEKLTVNEAIKLFTKYPAYASFTENTNGTIELSKRADLVVLDRNIYHIPCDEIKDVEISYTIIDGKIVYQA
ncbi:MAG: amidohydrolase [Aminipila sp.]